MDVERDLEKQPSAFINNKELLMLSIVKFYKKAENATCIIPIIDGKSEISLRLIDWFVTNYSKKRNVILTNKKNVDNTVSHFNVYINYRLQLKAYSKQQFDPFRRRDRILFYLNKDCALETTLGQLNFFKWILSHDILDYIIGHKEDIEQDMLVSQRHDNEKSDEEIYKLPLASGKKKRNELSKASSLNLNQFVGHTTLFFD